MSSPVLLPFAPEFLFPQEYTRYGLPTADDQPDITNLVQLASKMIDEFCGRNDGDGSGSLVYTTYQERIMSQSVGRSIFYLPHRPLVSLDATQQSLLIASGAAASQTAIAASSGDSQPYYTGFAPGTTILNPGPDTVTQVVSAILSGAGRYAYPRRDQYPLTDGMYAAPNPLTLITLFGGPPPWVPIDMTMLDYGPLTGELWIPTGMWLERYTEVIITYNSGFDPTRLPKNIKLATASLTKNLMAMGAGTTGIKSFRLGKSGISAQMADDMIDKNIQRLLQAFVSTRSY